MSNPGHNRNQDDDLLASAIPIDEQDDDEAPAPPPEPIDDDEEELAPIDVEADAPSSGERKIQAFGQRKPHEDHWQRTPNVTGQGAIHVKTFVSKLRLDAVEHLDEQVNQWLDAHPEYEVKFVTTTIGKLVGKNTEDAIFMNVWV